MTKENARLRDSLHEVETTASAALRSQPDGDEECRKHLRKALHEIFSIAAGGIVESHSTRGSPFPFEIS